MAHNNCPAFGLVVLTLKQSWWLGKEEGSPCPQAVPKFVGSVQQSDWDCCLNEEDISSHKLKSQQKSSLDDSPIPVTFFWKDRQD